MMKKHQHIPFRHITKKLQHAKSYGELYQPQAPLPLPSLSKSHNDENEEKYPSDSPQLSTSNGSRAASTATTVPISTRTTGNSSSTSNRIPFWERFKKIITPTKRNKDRVNSQTSIPSGQSNGIPANETSKVALDIFQMTFK